MDFHVDGIPYRWNSISMEFHANGEIPCRQNSVLMAFLSTEFRGHLTVHLVEKFIFFYEAILNNEQIIRIPTLVGTLNVIAITLRYVCALVYNALTLKRNFIASISYHSKHIRAVIALSL